MERKENPDPAPAEGGRRATTVREGWARDKERRDLFVIFSLRSLYSSGARCAVPVRPFFELVCRPARSKDLLQQVP